MSFLEMSLMGGAMILCILLLRLLFRGRLPASILSVMWAAALLRLILPAAIPSPISFLAFVSKAGQTQVMALPDRSLTSPAIPILFLYVWIGGAVLCTLFFLMMGCSQWRALRSALPAVMTPELRAAIDVQHLSRRVSLYTSDRISTPLTYGLIKPRIVLPNRMLLSGEEIKFVIAHECIHIARRDAAKKLILLAVVCLHWFNPLVWLMSAAVRRDMELNCDRQVLKAYGPEARASYARTLLVLQERKCFSGVLLDCFSKSPLEGRIRSIMSDRKTTLAGAFAAIAVFGCVAAVFATSPGTQSINTAGTVWVSATPIATQDAKLLYAPVTSVYIWNGDVLVAGQPGIEIASPYVAVMDLMAAGSLVENDISVSTKYGSAIALSQVQAAPALPVPVYSMTYTIKDGDIQP